jgi:hypothetical protein
MAPQKVQSLSRKFNHSTGIIICPYQPFPLPRRGDVSSAAVLPHVSSKGHFQCDAGAGPPHVFVPSRLDSVWPLRVAKTLYVVQSWPFAQHAYARFMYDHDSNSCLPKIPEAGRQPWYSSPKPHEKERDMFNAAQKRVSRSDDLLTMA